MDLQVEVRFVEGFDQYSTDPPLGRAAGLAHRLAVVQETHFPPHDGMYFDELLWKALVDFIRSRDRSGVILVAHEKPTAPTVPIEEYLKSWPATPQDDRQPPAVITLESNGRPEVCMVTDFWTDVGGPWPYADCYSYGLFTRQPVFAQLRAFLASRPEADRWDLALTSYRGEDVEMPDPFKGRPIARLLVGGGGVFALLTGGLWTLWSFGVRWPPGLLSDWAIRAVALNKWAPISAMIAAAGLGVAHHAWKRR